MRAGPACICSGLLLVMRTGTSVLRGQQHLSQHPRACPWATLHRAAAPIWELGGPRACCPCIVRVVSAATRGLPPRHSQRQDPAGDRGRAHPRRSVGVLVQASGAATTGVCCQKQGLHTPIVAMTADALAGDAEKCLAVGMDDSMAKPVTAERLAAVVAQWTPAHR